MILNVILALEFVCVGAGLINFNALIPRSLRLIVIYLGLSLLFELLLIPLPDKTGIWIRSQYDLMFPLEFALYINLFQPKLIRLFWSASVCLAGFGVYQLVWHMNDQDSATNLFLVMSLLMLPVLLLYFWSLISRSDVVVLYKEPLFWIAVSLLFFYSGNIIVTGFYFKLNTQDKKLSHLLFYINYTLTIVRYSVFTVAFGMAGRRHDER